MKTNTTTTTINSKVNSDATIPLRVPSSLKDALLIAATKDDRSLSSYIKRVLEAHVASLEAATTATFTMSAKPKAKAKAKK
jgi:predicted HicB family RNase H-like nuclease